MKIKLFAVLCLSVVLINLSACNKAPVKTESMLRFERVVSEQQSLIAQANKVLDDEVGNQPIENLSQLLFAKKLKYDSAAVFKDAGISGVEQPELIRLEQRIAHYQPTIAKSASEILIILAQKTITLREELIELRSQSYAANLETGDVGMSSYLGDLYKQDIDSCCLSKLADMKLFLADAPRDYDPLKKSLGKVVYSQEAIFTGTLSGKDYLDSLIVLQSDLEKLRRSNAMEGPTDR